MKLTPYNNEKRDDTDNPSYEFIFIVVVVFWEVNQGYRMFHCMSREVVSRERFYIEERDCKKVISKLMRKLGSRKESWMRDRPR